MRTEGEHGVFSPNLALDRCNDDLVIEAVQKFEKYRAGWSRWRDRAIADHNRMK